MISPVGPRRVSINFTEEEYHETTPLLRIVVATGVSARTVSMNQLALTASLLILVTTSGRAHDDPPQRPTPESIRVYARECILRDAPMNLVEQFGTDFRNLDLRDIDFRGVHRVGMESILSGVDFSGADLRGADFGAARLDGAVLRGADLRGARFTNARFDNADFTNAVIGNARFQECWFTGANLAGLDFSGATLNGCFFKDAILDGAVLQGAQNNLGWRDLTGVSLRDVDLSGFNFSDHNLSGADLSGANLTGVRFTRANLSNANLTDADIDGIVVDAAILDDVTGVDEARLQALRDDADRAGFESRQATETAAEARNQSIFAWSYPTVVLITFVFCGLAWRRSPTKLWPLTLLITNLLALTPPVFYFLLNLNETQELVRDNLSLTRLIGACWVTIWPIGVLGSLALMLGGFILAIWQCIRAVRGPGDIRRAAIAIIVVTALLTIVHGGFLLLTSFENAPIV